MQLLQLFGSNGAGLAWAVALLPAVALAALIMRIPAPKMPTSHLPRPRRTISAPIPDAPTAHQTSPRMTQDMQWERVTTELKTAQTRAQKAQTSHTKAGRQLDVADYDLARLMEELRPLMPQLGDSRTQIAANTAPDQPQTEQNQQISAPPAAQDEARPQPQVEPRIKPALPQTAAA